MPDQPLGLNELLTAADAQLPAGAESYPAQIGVCCDTCGFTAVHDYVVHTGMSREERLQVARDHLTSQEGWGCGPAGAPGDFCPRCSTPRHPEGCDCSSCTYE
ncbi:hypothetical protein ACFVQ4_25105 [Streptomyces laurentii]|uniref:hypothetical protein n=1 Tax=Streptomyces laurentii TaxID=39478 RepID=UPI0036B4B766